MTTPKLVYNSWLDPGNIKAVQYDPSLHNACQNLMQQWVPTPSVQDRKVSMTAAPPPHGGTYLPPLTRATLPPPGGGLDPPQGSSIPRLNQWSLDPGGEFRVLIQDTFHTPAELTDQIYIETRIRIRNFFLRILILKISLLLSSKPFTFTALKCQFLAIIYILLLNVCMYYQMPIMFKCCVLDLWIPSLDFLWLWVIWS